MLPPPPEIIDIVEQTEPMTVEVAGGPPEKEARIHEKPTTFLETHQGSVSWIKGELAISSGHVTTERPGPSACFTDEGGEVQG